jgi:hypothetical protein
MLLFRRSAKALLGYLFEIVVAGVLLHYNVKWFLFFWFVQSIFAAAGRYDSNRCLMRTYQIGNDCKFLAIMSKVGVTPEDAKSVFENNIKANMSEDEIRHLEDDFRIAMG